MNGSSNDIVFQWTQGGENSLAPGQYLVTCVKEEPWHQPMCEADERWSGQVIQKIRFAGPGRTWSPWPDVIWEAACRGGDSEMGRQAGASGSEWSPEVLRWERGCALLVLEWDARGQRRAGMRLSASLAESQCADSALSMSFATLGVTIFRLVSKHIVLMGLVLESPSPRMKFLQNLQFLREVSGFIYRSTFETRG